MSAPSWAVPGAKVVCVNTDGIADLPLCPAEGGVYTVATFEHPYIGIAENKHPDGSPSLWRAWRFRPLVTRSQEHDVAKFKHLLNTTPASEDA